MSLNRFAPLLLVGVICLLVLPSRVIAQSLNDGWVNVHMGSNGKTYTVHLKSLTFVGMPPQMVAFKIFEEGNSGYSSYELHCKDQKIKEWGVLHHVPQGENSVRRNLFDGFCGVSAGGRKWFLIGITKKPDSTKEIQSFFFFDPSSGNRIAAPFEGVSFEVMEFGLSAEKGFFPTSKSTLALNCKDPSQAGHRVLERGDFSLLGRVSPNSLIHSFNLLTCSSDFQNQIGLTAAKIEGASRPPKANDSELGITDDMKRICTDLGFKPGTEKFGDCVLRLSR
jgi:hypothetical protein